MNGLAELLRMAQEGSEPAYDELVRATLPGTYRFLRSLGAGEEEAADAVQETYIRAWKGLRRFDPDRSVLPWLYQIARRSLIDLYRKKRGNIVSLEKDAGGMTDIPDPEPLPDALFAQEATRLRVRAALAECSATERAVLTLRYDEELSFEDIAHALSLPSGTVRSIHHRALGKLRERLKDLL